MSELQRPAWNRTPVSRRRLGRSAFALTAGAAGYALVGCGGDDDDAGPRPNQTAAPPSAQTTTAVGPTAAAPKRGGELIYSLGAPTSQTLDPHKTLSLGFSYYGLFLDRLISPQRQTITPYQGELVQSWEQVDRTSFVFKVRSGATWHEGKPGGGRAVTADDIAFNLMRIAGKTEPAKAALYQRATNLNGMDRAEATDASTVRLTFSTPNSAFLAGLSDWRNWAIPREVVDRDPDFRDVKNITGSGPFIMDAFDETTMAGHYVANRRYWKPDQPYADSVSQVSLPDTAATQAAFLSGKIDFVAAMSNEVRSQMSKRANSRQVAWTNTLWDYLGMNQARAPLSDVRVRRAIFKAIDYTTLMETEYGKGYWDYTSVLLSGFPGAPTPGEVSKLSPWNPATKQQDLAEAKQLMSAAGFPEGTITFRIMPSSGSGYSFNHAIRIQDQLKKIWPGIQVDVTVPADNGAFNKDLAAGNYDAVIYVAGPPPDAIFDIAQRLRTGGSRNYTKHTDSQLDVLVDQVFAEFDAAARSRLLGQVHARVTENILNIPIGKQAQVLAFQGRIQGFDGYSGVGSSLYAYDHVNAAGQLSIA